VLALGCGLLLLGCGATAPPGKPTAQQAIALRIPLATAGNAVGPAATSTASDGATWALVAMGDPAQPDNTFWQAFVLRGTARSWSLVTPKGVADNGGLVGSFGAGGVVVGVEVSQLLGFSPLAVSGDDGAQWSPAVLFGPLAPVPDALATTGSGHLLAVLGKTGSSIVTSDDDAMSPASTVTTLSSLSALSGSSCRLAALTAVTFGPAGQPMVGGLCEGSAQVGIFQLTARGWRLVGPEATAPTLGPGSSHGRHATRVDVSSLDTEVLRLSTEGSSVVALAEVVSPDGTASVFRLSSNSSGTWTDSPVFDVPPTQRLSATGTEPNGSTFVLLSHSDTVTAEVLPASGAGWARLPALPTGTATLAFAQDGRTFALAVHQSLLTVYDLSQTGSWNSKQVIIVPIQFGSSS
jgi:hypothetical protein